MPGRLQDMDERLLRSSSNPQDKALVTKPRVRSTMESPNAVTDMSLNVRPALLYHCEASSPKLEVVCVVAEVAAAAAAGMPGNGIGGGAAVAGGAAGPSSLSSSS